MSLRRKLARLEVVVAARTEDATPAYLTPEWRARVAHILATMPEDAGRRALAELAAGDRARYGPVTRRLVHLAELGAHELHGDGWPHYGRVVALPAAVCAVLEAHPDALWTSDFSCEDCGLQAPHRGPDDWGRHAEQLRAEGRAPRPEDRALMTTCPLCGGRVHWAGFAHGRYRAAWRRQVDATG